MQPKKKKKKKNASLISDQSEALKACDLGSLVRETTRQEISAPRFSFTTALTGTCQKNTK